MAAKRAPASSERNDAPLTVAQLSARIDGVLRDGFPAAVRVRGEVSGFRDRTHWYFDVKDSSAVLNCVMFRSAIRRSAVALRDGVEVVVRGRVEFYAPQGRVTIVVESIDPVGDGAMDAALRALVEEARALGWLDPDRKRPIPRFPARVGVVTSASGAALQDVIVTMRRRCPAVGLLVADVRVQGADAAGEIRSAIDEFSSRAGELGIHAVLVTRGGGSKEDLACFNDRAVARAIVTCFVPVVAAIGHETDTTLAELVADERCATPTQAAMRLTPDAGELLRQADSMLRRIEAQARRVLAAERRHLESLATRSILRDPLSWVRSASSETRVMADSLRTAVERRIEFLAGESRLAAANLERHSPRAVNAARRERLGAMRSRVVAATRKVIARQDLAAFVERSGRAMRSALERASARAGAADGRLHAVSPASVIERGFSVTTTADGRLVRSTSGVRPGDRLSTRVADGNIDSVVGSALREADPTAPIRRDRPARPRDPSASGPGLFGSA